MGGKPLRKDQLMQLIAELRDKKMSFDEIALHLMQRGIVSRLGRPYGSGGVRKLYYELRPREREVMEADSLIIDEEHDDVPERVRIPFWLRVESRDASWGDQRELHFKLREIIRILRDDELSPEECIHDIRVILEMRRGRGRSDKAG